MRWFRSALRSSSAVVLAASAVHFASPSDLKSAPATLQEPTESTLNRSALLALRRRCLSSLTIRREEAGAPGLSMCVSLRGRRLLSGGVGFADVENLTPCNERSVLRVASISKCFTAVLAAQLVETGLLDLDKPIGEYLTEPEMKKFSKMTTRQLLSHTAGVRHYHIRGDSSNSNELSDSEYYISKYYATATEATKELLCNDTEAIAFEPPGSQYLYSTHGYTLLGAVLERLSGDKPVADLLDKLFVQLGLSAGTFLERHAPIVGWRGRQYQRDSKKKLINSAYIDNSYKYTGGGVLSCAEDLLTFGETLIRCANGEDCNDVLKPETVQILWSPMPGTEGKWGAAFFGPYCLGFKSVNYRGEHVVLHTGASVGGTSILVMAPRIGVVIAILCNLEDVSLTGLAASVLDSVLNFLEETASADANLDLSATSRF